MKANGPFRDRKLWVLSRKCSTCIFRPGNKMHLEHGGVKSMVQACIEDNTVIVCHQTLDEPRSTCRGLYDLHKGDIVAIRLAHALDIIAFDDPPEEH